MGGCIHQYHGKCVEEYIVNNLSERQLPTCPLCDVPMLSNI